MNTICPECQAQTNCQDHFHEMSAWELEYGIYEVHHLMVLSYHLQHPSLYSPEGLRGAKQLLTDFLIHGLTPQQIRQRDSTKLDSGQRPYKIKGTHDSHGAYDHPVQWTLRAEDVTAGGVENYVEKVQAWAQSVYNTLQASGNL